MYELEVSIRSLYSWKSRNQRGRWRGKIVGVIKGWRIPREHGSLTVLNRNHTGSETEVASMGLIWVITSSSVYILLLFVLWFSGTPTSEHR